MRYQFQPSPRTLGYAWDVGDFAYGVSPDLTMAHRWPLAGAKGLPWTPPEDDEPSLENVRDVTADLFSEVEERMWACETEFWTLDSLDVERIRGFLKVLFRSRASVVKGRDSQGHSTKQLRLRFRGRRIEHEADPDVGHLLQAEIDFPGRPAIDFPTARFDGRLLGMLLPQKITGHVTLALDPVSNGCRLVCLYDGHTHILAGLGNPK